MKQILGAVMVASALCYLGWRKARGLAERVWALKALDGALEQMQRELEYHLTPLPQLMQELSQHTHSPAKELFEGCRMALDGLEREQFSAAWRRLVQEIPNMQHEDRRTLEPLGRIFGRYDGRGQAESIVTVRRNLGEQILRAREEEQRLGKIYRTLGAAGGGFLIILLL